MKKKDNIVKDVEIYMLAQFVDVLESIEEIKDIKKLKKDIELRTKMYREEIEEMENNEDIFCFDEINKTLDEKIEKYSKLYCENKSYKKIIEEIEEMKNKIKCNKEKIIELENLIYEKFYYDFVSAYKIGMIEGIKTMILKNKF